MERPFFDDLPMREGDPPHSAWGLYGEKDELGTLNLLTPEIVQEAAREIRTGIRVPLDYPVDHLLQPSHGRQPLQHTVIRGKKKVSHDDVISMNTQISSQWDGYRHVAYQKSGLFYNGFTADDISGQGATRILGTDAWVKRGGIVGRGILIDYLQWAQSENREYDLLEGHAITADEMQACASAQNLEIKHGDILFVRSGFSVGYAALGEEQKIAWSSKPAAWTGIETSLSTARWLWNSGFSACAGDAPGWEAFPTWSGRSDIGGGSEDLALHEVMLSGWGMPIGEMFDLEELSKQCLRLKRYSFFVSSMPIHITGGVGSPPNAVAIF
ncbi:uncharacterized protein A1O9_12844 [Exophiala aquamarina CBS 119918]|uniref:Cyclase n=1 Tax=Exophiala aquamarina CBS 119918 TaxID=1182545 RepID=A0A072NTZ8_9EURO|nr:uncharacterized protein A1O9_12844 [Exophiala aquamarina CBS 119918]KEF51121.1 hypothetical protein A1O9_12844 [Exophiala aquamarina CBS 119918]